MKKIVNKVLKKFGFSLIQTQNWRPLSEFEKLKEPKLVIDLIRENTMLTSSIRLINIREAVNYVINSKIYGAYVECGVWKGGSSAFAAYCFKRMNKIVPIHLFDIFDDICEPDASVDGERAIKDVGGIQNAQGRLSSIVGVYDKLGGYGKDFEVKELLCGDVLKYPSTDVFIYKGWFQDTLPKVSSTLGPISILRLDGDWYSSTKVCLEELYHYVNKGGVIIIDDYGAYEGCKKAVDEFLKTIEQTPFLIKVDDECVFFIKTE